LSARVLISLACLGLTAYFAHHAVSGRHGLDARQRLLHRAPEAARELAELEATRRRLQADVTLLSPNAASKDLVEEMARELLGYVLPSDIVLVGR